MKEKKNLLINFASLLMIGLSIASCSNEDSIIEGAQKYTMTVEALKTKEGHSTRALSLEGKTLTATWATTEYVYVTKAGTSLGTLQPQSNGVIATLKGDLTGTISVSDELSLMFPRANIDYRNQDGTLATIASSFDYATATATVTAISDGRITADAVNFANQQAIVKFVLTNKFTGEAIDASTFSVSDGANNHLVSYISGGIETKGPITISPTSSTWTANGGTGIIYAALRGVNNSNISISVNDQNYKHFQYVEKTGITFEHGKYYIVNIALVPEPDEYKSISSGNITIPSGKHYSVSGTSSSNTITLQDGAYLTLNNVHISGTNVPIYCQGDAYITIQDGTTNTLSTTGNSCAGIQVGASGKTLYIHGKTGTLDVNTKGGAGIGTGNSYGTYGNIIINGGVINTSAINGSAGYGAGIGSGSSSNCGDITINGGTITAIGGRTGAGIGSGPSQTCGNITINGGTIIAKGASHAAAIGSGYGGTCGSITIGSKVTQITASSGCTGYDDPDLSYPVDCDLIGNGYSNPGNSIYATCGTVTIDGVSNATTASTFTHFNSAVSQTRREQDTWTLTHK